MNNLNKKLYFLIGTIWSYVKDNINIFSFLRTIKKMTSNVLQNLKEIISIFPKFNLTNRFISTSLMLLFVGGIFVDIAMAQKKGIIANVPFKKNIDLEEYTNRTTAFFILGYKKLDFFTSEDDVREMLISDEIAVESEITERIAEIYIFPSVKQSFLMYQNISKKFLGFNFASLPMEQMLEKMREQRANYRIGHLTQRRARQFKVLSIPAREDRPWEIELYFFRRLLNDQDVYRLFGVTLNLVAGEKIQDLTLVNANYMKRTMRDIYKKYKSPTYKISKQITKKAGAGLVKTTISFDRIFKTINYVPNFKLVADSHNNDNFSLNTQLNVSYLSYQSDIANLQINYLSTDYLNEIMPEFNYYLSEYGDFLDDDIIDF